MIATNDERRRAAFDELDRGAVRIADQDEADLAAAFERVRERFAPHDAAERAHAVDRGVEVGNAHPEPLESVLDDPSGRRADRSRFVPLQEVDRPAVVPARPEQDRRVPARAIESERGAGLRDLRCGVRPDREAEPVGVEAPGRVPDPSSSRSRERAGRRPTTWPDTVSSGAVMR